MICNKCGHFADDHTLQSSWDTRYCIVAGCDCTGWIRKPDRAEDFLPEIDKSKELKELLNKLEPGLLIKWDENGKPHIVKRKD